MLTVPYIGGNNKKLLLDRSLCETRSLNISDPIEIDSDRFMHFYESDLDFIIEIRPFNEYKNDHIPSSLNLSKNIERLNSLNFSNSNKIIIIFSDESSNISISRVYSKLEKRGSKKYIGI